MYRGFDRETSEAGGFSASRFRTHSAESDSSGPGAESAGPGELRRKLADLKRAKQSLLDRCMRRVRVIEDQMRLLKNGRTESRDASGDESLPSVRLLASPLVVQSEQGEFLGVQGGRGHFALKDFIELMQRGCSGGKSLELDWQRNRKNWVLLISAKDMLTGVENRVVLVVRRFVTPAGNTVALIVRFAIDGRDAGTEALLDMLRKIRAGYDSGRRD